MSYDIDYYAPITFFLAGYNHSFDNNPSMTSLLAAGAVLTFKFAEESKKSFGERDMSFIPASFTSYLVGVTAGKVAKNFGMFKRS